jgi:hypothetical protein
MTVIRSRLEKLEAKAGVGTPVENAKAELLRRLAGLADRLRGSGCEPRSIAEHLAAGDPDGRAAEYLAERFASGHDLNGPQGSHPPSRS